MKNSIVFIFVIVGIFILFQSYTTLSINNSDSQMYRVIRMDTNFEIRFYLPTAVATFTSSEKNFDALNSVGVSKLQNYINRGNNEKQIIPMTTPIHFDINDSVSSVSFVMPLTFNASNLPKPIDAQVSVKNIPDEHVAVIQFGGFATEKDISIYTEKLKAILKANAIPFYGNFRFLCYNPSYQLIDRKNEIIVDVQLPSEK